MKSFFKKLAFVMALAMVVSMVAPAGDAFAAESGIAIQGTDTIVTEYTFEKAPATFDFCFKGAPSDWKSTYEWTSSNEAVATVDKTGLVAAVAPGTATITITAGADKSYVETVKITVKEQVEDLTAKQTTARAVKVVFTDAHAFDATGADSDEVNTVKVYRVFSTEEMAKMPNKNGLKFDEEGNGYQAYYVRNVEVNYTKDGKEDYTTWTISGYDWFVDGATYAVVYGENETSSTINGIKDTFTAYVGKPASIDLWASQATVENDVEPAIPADIYCTIYNKQKIDITEYCDASDYFADSDEVDYEVLTEDLDVSVSGAEVIFGEEGVALVEGTYTFYDEDLEEDVTLTDKVEVIGGNYSSYRVVRIVNWSLENNFVNFAKNWSKTTTEMIAEDDDQLYVIVEDNRGNLLSNVPGIEAENVWLKNSFGKKVQVKQIGDNDNTAFEQYGYELVFDSLDPDSLLVDPDGYVTSYKKTNSFAVVSYKRADDEAAKLYEIGIMGIKVKAARELDKVDFGTTSFTVLAETEAEDGEENYYGHTYEDNGELKCEYGDFKLLAYLKVTLKNQYGGTWPVDKDGNVAIDASEVEPEYTVTTAKDEFDHIADRMEADLNSTGTFFIDASIFPEDTTATSVTFKVKESATGDSANITIKLDKPKYNEDGSVYVDPNKAILDVAGAELYTTIGTDAKLFQVSKASQKVGYVRVGELENDPLDADGERIVQDENRNYYLATKVLKSSFTVDTDEDLADYLTTASTAALSVDEDLNLNDYILVVTDPNGKIVPEAGKGGVGMAFDDESNVGLKASADATHFDFVLAAMSKTEDAKGNALKSELEYATPGTYRATVYKVSNRVYNDDGSVKYTLSRVSNDTFKIDKTFKDVTFFHQETTKTLDISSFLNADGTVDEDALFDAVALTMTFKIDGQKVNFDEDDDYKDTYKSYMDYWDGWWGKHNLTIQLIGVDAEVQKDGMKAVIDNVIVRVSTPAGKYYDCKVKVNRSVNATK